MITLKHLHHLLDWPARHELDERKSYKQNTEQRWNHEQQPLDDVTQ